MKQAPHQTQDPLHGHPSGSGGPRYSLAMWLLPLALPVACTRAPERVESPVAATVELIVEPAQLTLQAGSSAELRAQANDAARAPIGGASFAFAPEDAALLRVSDSGLVESLGKATQRTHVVVKSGQRSRRVPIVVQPGPVARIEKLPGESAKVIAGAAPRLAVRALDEWGNPVSGLELGVEGAGLREPGALRTASDGTLSLELTPLERAGLARILVRPRDATSPAAVFETAVQPDSPARIAGSARPTSAATGEDGPIIDIAVSDRFGNPAPGTAVALVAPPELTGDPVNTDAHGTASFTLPATLSRGKALPKTLTFALVEIPVVRAQVELPSNLRGR